MGFFLVQMVSLFIGVNAHAQNTCVEIFAVKPSFGTLRRDFTHSPVYTVDVSKSFPVKNQCATPLCHLHAWSSDLQMRGNMEVSNEYMSAAFLYTSAQKALNEGNPKFITSLGAGPVESRAAIASFGLIPKEQWSHGSEFMRDPHLTRLLETLQSVVTETTFALSRETAKNTKEEILANGRENIDFIFRELFGDWRAPFHYRGQTYSPESFAQFFFPELFYPLVRMTLKEEGKFSLINFQKPEDIEMRVSMEEMQSFARKVLDSGFPVYVSYQHKSQYVDNTTGIMTIQGFDYPSFVSPISRSARGHHNLWTNMHAILLVGYEIDPATGLVTKWKVQNSWGSTSGDRGVYHMYDDYFRAYVLMATFINDGSVPIALSTPAALLPANSNSPP